MASATQPLTKSSTRNVHYPSEDGKPMAETDKHAELMTYFRQALKTYFDARPEVYVAGNNFVYWEEGNPKARVSPDCYVVFGAGSHLRDSYKAWENGGRLPDVVFEFPSKSTRREDTDTKLPLYEKTLRVPEYFLFDPTGDYLRPRLQGYRLQDGVYHPLELADGRLHSERLGLDLVPQGEEVRLYDPRQAKFLMTAQELARRADWEALRAEMERKRAEAETRRAEAETQRAEAQTRLAVAETQRADAEAVARRYAEAELERLRAELAALKGRPDA